MSRRSNRKHRRSPLGWPAFVVGVALIAVAGLAAGPVRAATVVVAAAGPPNPQFTPSDATIHVGDNVTWTFAGADPHTVTSGIVADGVPAPDGRFDSPLMNPGGSFTLGPAGSSNPFTAPGTYPYFCRIHPEQMTGTIVVMGDATPPPQPTPQPTPRPTPRPTPAPTPPPPSPSTAAPATLSPTASPTSRPSPSASAASTASASAGVSPPTVTASPGPGPSEPGPARGSGTALVVVAVLAALSVAGAMLYFRRRGAG